VDSQKKGKWGGKDWGKKKGGSPERKREKKKKTTKKRKMKGNKGGTEQIGAKWWGK